MHIQILLLLQFYKTHKSASTTYGVGWYISTPKMAKAGLEYKMDKNVQGVTSTHWGM